jgi:hypothetical protein
MKAVSEVRSLQQRNGWNSTPPEEHSYHFTAYRSVCKLGNDFLQVAPLRISDLFIGALAILYVK